MSADAASLHARMIDGLLEKQYLRSPRIQQAFRAVPRHPFLPGFPLEEVYGGGAIVIQEDAAGRPTSSSSEPGVMAVMLEQLQPGPGQRVLEIGAGSGYNAALLADLVGAEGQVTSVDIDAEIARGAGEHLSAAGFSRVRVEHGDGWLGAPQRAPFDLIEATVAVSDLSPHWVEQLADGGLLLAPLQLRGGAQVLAAFRKGERLVSDSVRGGGFMSLRGPHGADVSHTIVLDGFRATLAERPSDAAVATLRALLQEEPRREDLGQATPPWYGWYLRLALEEPRAIVLSKERPAGEWHAMPGVFDASSVSLALLDVEARGETRAATLLAYGRADAATRLREAMARHPLAPERLRIEAVPLVEGDERDGAWALTRRYHRFLLWETA